MTIELACDIGKYKYVKLVQFHCSGLQNTSFPGVELVQKKPESERMYGYIFFLN